MIFGGTDNVDERDVKPWMDLELEELDGLIAGGTPVLGICLGGQLIAEAAGGSVFPLGHEGVAHFLADDQDRPGRELHLLEGGRRRGPGRLLPGARFGRGGGRRFGISRLGIGRRFGRGSPGPGRARLVRFPGGKKFPDGS